MKISTAINAHKALVIPVVVGLMYWYRNWSTEAFVYLALHGTYSLLWLTKHALFRDPGSRRRSRGRSRSSSSSCRSPATTWRPTC